MEGAASCPKLRFCCKCGYDLRGTSERGLCPECGTPVRYSIRHDALYAADPIWLRDVIRGANGLYVVTRTWIAITIALFVLLLAVMFLPLGFGMLGAPQGGGGAGDLYSLAFIVLLLGRLAMAVLYLFGAYYLWLFTRREPYFHAGGQTYVRPERGVGAGIGFAILGIVLALLAILMTSLDSSIASLVIAAVVLRIGRLVERMPGYQIQARSIQRIARMYLYLSLGGIALVVVGGIVALGVIMGAGASSSMGAVGIGLMALVGAVYALAVIISGIIMLFRFRQGRGILLVARRMAAEGEHSDYGLAGSTEFPAAEPPTGGAGARPDAAWSSSETLS